MTWATVVVVPIGADNARITGRVGETQRVVPNVAIEIPRLRITRKLVKQRNIWATKSPLCPGKVPSPKVIEASFRISFFAGEPLRHRPRHPITPHPRPRTPRTPRRNLLPKRQIIRAHRPHPTPIRHHPRTPQLVHRQIRNPAPRRPTSAKLSTPGCGFSATSDPRGMLAKAGRQKAAKQRSTVLV